MGLHLSEVRIVGFQGVRAARYATALHPHESGLIKAGHIGISLDGGQTIYGFHPTPEAIAAFASPDDAFIYLRDGKNELPGGVYDDTAVFARAAELARQGVPTDVWQLSIPVSAAEFARIADELQQTVAKGSALGIMYRLSLRRGAPMPEGSDNCATWPRNLGLPLLHVTGQIRRCLEVLKDKGVPWP